MEKVNLTRRGFLAGTAATGAVAALALSGCGGGESSSSSSAATSSSAAEGSSAATEAKGGKITAAQAFKLSNANPVGMNGGSATGIAGTWHIAEGLYDMDVRDSTFYKALAADDDPKIVDDTHYEVTLRDGAKFSDGTDVKADDVVKSFEGAMADGNIGSFFGFVKAVTAKDDKTVAFELNYPFEKLFKARCAMAKIVPASMTEDELSTMPIGSGPWKYVSIDGEDGGIVEFAPNEHYNGAHPATADSMTWNILMDADARTTALTEAAALAVNALPAANEDLVNGVGAAVDFVPGFQQPFFMFNTTKKPFDDYRVRQAFFYAIDVEKLIANQELGHAKPLKGFLPEYMPDFQEASTVYTYDPEKSKALLKEAGVEKLEVELLTNNTWVEALVAPVKNDLDAVGITVTPKVEAIQWSELNTDKPTFDVVMTSGDATCFGTDPDLLMGWWYNDNLWMAQRTCWKNTDPENFNKLQDAMQKAREEADDGVQKTLWKECFDIIAQYVPLYGLYHMDMVTGYYADKLQGFEPIATTGLYFIGTTPVE